jgi:hypothetical protein
MSIQCCVLVEQENPADTNDDSVTSCISSMDLLKVAEPDEKILSSSLEAEHR